MNFSTHLFSKICLTQSDGRVLLSKRNWFFKYIQESAILSIVYNASLVVSFPLKKLFHKDFCNILDIRIVFFLSQLHSKDSPITGFFGFIIFVSISIVKVYCVHLELLISGSSLGPLFSSEIGMSRDRLASTLAQSVSYLFQLVISDIRDRERQTKTDRERVTVEDRRGGKQSKYTAQKNTET